MGEFNSILYISLFYKNFYDDYGFYKIKFPLKDLYNREKRWQVIEKNVQKLGDSFKSSIPWAKYYLEMRRAGKNAKDNKIILIMVQCKT